MLDFLRRHHKTFWIVVTVVIIISFTFWGATTKTGNRGGFVDDTFMTVYGHGYNKLEVDRLVRYAQLARTLGMTDYARGLQTASFRVVLRGSNYPVDFAANLMVLRHQMEKNGVKVSDAEANDAFRRLPVFQTKEGEFNGAMADAFEKNMLGSMGMSAKDVLDLMRDSVGFEKLQQIVGGNTVADPGIVEKRYAAAFQTISALNIPFSLEEFKKSAKVTDEEISKYYDQNKAKYKSDPKRSVSYVYLEKPKDLEKGTPEEQAKNKTDKANFAQQVNDFYTIDTKDKFEALAKEKKLELHALPAFAQASPPDALKDEAAVVEEIFSNDPKTHPVSSPVEGKNGFYVFEVTNVEEPKQQELKEVKDKIKDLLAAQKGQEDMMKAASDTRTKLEAALKAGKKIDDAVKEAKVKAEPVPDFVPADPPPNQPDIHFFTEEAYKTAPGEFTKPIQTGTGVSVLYVKNKTLFKSPESGDRMQRAARAVDSQTQTEIFRAWFEKCRDEADAKLNVKFSDA